METFFPLFPIIFPHYFFNVPLNTRVATSSQVVLGGKKEREEKREKDASFFFVDSAANLFRINAFTCLFICNPFTYLISSLISRTIVFSLARYTLYCIKIGLKSKSKGIY